MSVTLTPHVEDQIQRLLETGHYTDVGEVIEQAVHLLEEREHGQRLRESVAEGFAAIKRGEGIELTRELMDELTREADEHERQGLPLNADVCP